MNTIETMYQAWTFEVQQPGNVSQSEATDILQTFAPTITDIEGDAWWVAVATRYDSLNIITPGTYVGLRNHANNNEQPANDLFNALLFAINELPESQTINAAIAHQNRILEESQISGNILIIEGNKTGDQQLDQAYDEAIFSLERYRQQLIQEIGA